MQKIFIKKCFLFTVRSVYRVKRFTTGWQTFRWWRRGWNGGAEVAETTVRRLLRHGFRRTGKAMGQVYQFWWRICRETDAFSSFEYHMFTFYTHLWPIYWLSLLFTCEFRVSDFFSSCFSLGLVEFEFVPKFHFPLHATTCNPAKSCL
jgi:hypothetical protein